VKYAIATDIHLNFLAQDGLCAFAAAIKWTESDGLFLTGDIAEAKSLAMYLTFLQLETGKPVYFVCGNHDFYGSSTEAVRAMLADLHRQNPQIHYLRETFHKLTETTALVGVDGWGDARLGLPKNQRIVLSDWTYIEDYKRVNADRFLTERMRIAESYGLDEARVLDDRLYEVAKAGFPNVIVLTHVPPFKLAAWHQGKPSDDNWLPWFTCKATGDVLARYAETHPEVNFVVYCGHTHSAGVYQHTKNLIVYTNAAEYGAPRIASVIDV
jgi:3',5'-cyclic AMP phosphodiesterase CpdA